MNKRTTRPVTPASSDLITRLVGQVNALQQEVRRNTLRLSTLETAEALRAAGRKPRRPIEFRSQFGEDALIWQLTGQQLEGFYIEVGAFDGYNYSVTYALDCIGWNGLLIEAIPERYEECVRRRPDARVVHAALGAPGSPPSVRLNITDDGLGEMMSYLDSSILHARTVKDLKKRSVTVPMTTMDELLADHSGEIDVAVIDVEGAEGEVLQGFDLRKHRPKLIVLEDNEPKNPHSLAVTAMSFAPYTQIGWHAVNRIYIRNDLADEWRARL